MDIKTDTQKNVDPRSCDKVCAMDQFVCICSSGGTPIVGRVQVLSYKTVDDSRFRNPW